jgi:hypothetical protein
VTSSAGSCAAGFGYIPTPIQVPGAADPKGVHLSQIVRSCIRLRS